MHVSGSPQTSLPNEMEKRVDAIKSMLESMNHGVTEIISAYHTAWVGLVEAEESIMGSTDSGVSNISKPQFSECLRRIADDQLPDGSWGDPEIFLGYDRIINTLACIVALRKWDLYPNKCQMGISFLKENFHRLEDDDEENMLSGFEVVFPMILEMAQKMEIYVQEDSPVLQDIYAKRNLKLTRIPYEILHKESTSLFSLEGIGGLDWDKFLRLQSRDGSFLSSPSSPLPTPSSGHGIKVASTTWRKLFTGSMVECRISTPWTCSSFCGQWIGWRDSEISRYFDEEIKACMDYVSRTHLKKPSLKCLTVMFNLYRASQLQFPDQTILQDAREYSKSFLTQKRAAGKLLDKWIITKDLPGEVGYALCISWYVSLSRLETRFYIEQYGGKDDVWIGKTLYRLPHVSNNVYLELAKLDYNDSQACHQSEWEDIQRWYTESEMMGFGMGRKDLLFAYFVAAASIFEPVRAVERLAWAKTLTLVETISSFCHPEGAFCCHERRAFVHEFQSSAGTRDYENGSVHKTNGQQKQMEMCSIDFRASLSLAYLSFSTNLCFVGDMMMMLRKWEKWPMGLEEEGEKEVDRYKGIAELLVQTICLAGGHCFTEDLVSFPSYPHLSRLSDELCRPLGHLKSHRENGSHYRGCAGTITDPSIESTMRELVQSVLEGSATMDRAERNMRDTFHMVVKSFYYGAHCDPGTTELHIVKVLFEKVN
ncbi:hypothetical protein SAY86_023190 [Trapa natans]|uniref:Uncharacterized protein n=1 Tax=Trapa natans TaxID=22666 RepID=A0AAN7R949_TRANT|nr:hypothetical protein SAY86_023190 [Trapa natans]